MFSVKSVLETNQRKLERGGGGVGKKRDMWGVGAKRSTSGKKTKTKEATSYKLHIVCAAKLNA